MFSIHFDVTISRNRIRLTSSKTRQTIDRMAGHPFSSEHRLIADRDGAFKFLRDLILESNGRSRLLQIWASADISIAGEPNSEADREEVRQLFVEQGFTKIHFA